MKADTDKRLEILYAKMVKGENDTTLLKNLLEANTLVDEFVDASKTEMLNRSLN